MKRTNIWLKVTQIRDLKSIARETGATVAGLIRKAIDEFTARWKAAKENSHHGESKEQR
jgi:hypothetical protein